MPVAGLDIALTAGETAERFDGDSEIEVLPHKPDGGAECTSRRLYMVYASGTKRTDVRKLGNPPAGETSAVPNGAQSLSGTGNQEVPGMFLSSNHL